MEHEPEPPPRRSSGIWTVILAGGLVGLIGLGVLGLGAFFLLPDLMGTEARPIEDVPLEDGMTDGGEDEGTDGEEPSEDGELPAEDGEHGEEGTGEEPAEATPEPAPEPAPAPAAEPDPAPAPAPRAPTAASLSKQGWNAMGNPGAALDFFDQAIALDAGFGEAWYGRGYALVKLDRKDDGRDSLCKAKGIVDARTAGEIDGFLQGNDLSCE